MRAIIIGIFPETETEFILTHKQTDTAAHWDNVERVAGATNAYTM